MNTIQLIGYAAVAFCLIATALKLIRIARMPVHLRWDLYPIPHEKGRGAYGGSYYEEVDWWTKPRTVSRLSELRAMAIEIFFVHSLFRNNRSLWLVSYPFHLGLYCLVGFTLLILSGSLLELSGITVGSTEAGTGWLVARLTVVLGAAGWVLTVLGAAGLALSRIVRAELRQASLPTDYLNLALLLTVSAAGLFAWVTADPDYAELRRFIGDTLVFGDTPRIPTALSVQVLLTSALLVYFPFTHMTHMFSKFFTYHSVRWEDQPNIRGGRIEKAVTEALGRPLSWSAPHVPRGTWADAARDGRKPDHE